MSRRLALLVNPAAAGGKALAKVPAVEEELRSLGAEFRVVQSDSGDHAKLLAREMAAAGEVAVAIGGDGLVGEEVIYFDAATLLRQLGALPEPADA